MATQSIVEMASAQFMASAGTPPIVWTRNSGGANNTVIMNDEMIAVGTLKRSERKSVEDDLAGGKSIEEILGPHATRIRFQAITAVTACLDGTVVEVLYEKGGRRQTTCRFDTASQEAQADILVEARNRMSGKTEVVESNGSRLWKAMKPFNLLVILVVLTIGVQDYFTTDLFNGKANRQRLESWGKTAKPEEIRWTRAKQGAFVKTVARNPALQKVMVFGIIVLGVVGGFLNMLGYTATMTILLSLTAAALIWTFARLVNPPRTMSVIACRPGAL